MKCFFVTMCLVIGSIGFANQDSNSSLPPPYNEVEVLPPNYFNNWFCNKSELKYLINKCDISVVVELGSWLGASAIYMAKELPINGKVYCVDHWEGSEEHHQPHRTDVKHLLPILYQQFLSNVIHAGLTHIIVPVKMSTNEAVEILNVSPGLVYVDAAHDEASVYRDISDWYKKLAPGGIMCGDDWPRDGVNQAVKRYAREHNISIYAHGNFWSYPPK